MGLYDHGLEKYGSGDVLQSAVACEWRGIGAELRYHPPGELPTIDVKQTEIGVATAAHRNAVVSRCGNGARQTNRVQPGTIWTCPAGVREEQIRLFEWHKCFHIYLPHSRFEELADAAGGAAVRPEDILYLADLPDPLIRQTSFALLESIAAPTAAARLLAETLALTLTARLAQTCTPNSAAQAKALVVTHALDDVRLGRVLAFIEAHIEDDIGLDDLANVACLSPFHFSRMFARRTGLPPSRFVGQRRLERAEAMLAAGKMKIGEIALACCFSSQANFSRAFRRATGHSPGAYRRLQRP